MTQEQEYLYNKILKMPKSYVAGIKKSITPYGYRNEFNSSLEGINLSEEFIQEIYFYYTLCKNAMDVRNNMIAFDLDSVALERNKYTILANEIKLITDKVKEKLKRSKIVGKVYNYMTNKVEYELEDGSFVQIEGDKLIPPKIQLDKSVFPDCFLYVSGDIASMRGNRIDSIFDETES